MYSGICKGGVSKEVVSDKGGISMGHTTIVKLVLQKRWSFTRVVCQKRYYCICTYVLYTHTHSDTHTRAHTHTHTHTHTQTHLMIMPLSTEKLSVGRPEMFHSRILTGSPRVALRENSSDRGIPFAEQN